jgi:signal peptidase II
LSRWEAALDGAAETRAPGRLRWGLSALVIAVDQLAKALVTIGLPLYGSKTVIPGVVDLVHVQNMGVAFGFLHDLGHPQQVLITTGLALVALIGIGYYARHIRADEYLARVGLALILGGALGNLVDRFRYGYVIDFVDVYWRDWHFWVFNVADAAITVGAILVFVDLLFMNRHASDPV